MNTVEMSVTIYFPQHYMENINITNPQETEKLIQQFTHDGSQKLHIVTDFDKTLTKTYVDGKARASLVSILRDNDHLINPAYAKKAHELFNHYHPQEKDPHMLPEKKKKTFYKNDMRNTLNSGYT